MPNPPTPDARRGRAALQAACLTAGLATAFGPSPAQATVTSSGFQATNAGQATPIFDGYVLNASPISLDSGPDSVTPIASSQTAASPANYGVAVFSPNFGTATLSGQSFENTFLVPNGDFLYPDQNYTEAEVVNYIASNFTDTNATDQNAYDDFLGNLYKYYSPANGPTPGAPISAYGFSNGQPLGTISAAQFNNNTPSLTGFGLVAAQATVPEPNTLPLLLLGGSALLGVTLARRRRTQSDEQR